MGEPPRPVHLTVTLHRRRGPRHPLSPGRRGHGREVGRTAGPEPAGTDGGPAQEPVDPVEDCPRKDEKDGGEKSNCLPDRGTRRVVSRPLRGAWDPVGSGVRKDANDGGGESESVPAQGARRGARVRRFERIGPDRTEGGRERQVRLRGEVLKECHQVSSKTLTRDGLNTELGSCSVPSLTKN